MNLNILYFARVKELLNLASEEIVVPTEVDTILQLKDYMAQRGDVWQALFKGQGIIRAAINQTLVADDAKLNDGDEVAFFPPVTGG